MQVQYYHFPLIEANNFTPFKQRRTIEHKKKGKLNFQIFTSTTTR